MSNTPITIRVDGIPRPGGSKRGFAFKRANGKLGVTLVDASGEKGKDWRGDVKHAARQEVKACGWQIPAPNQPLFLTLMLLMPRPKSHYRKSGALKPNAPCWHTGRPDATKLLRSIEDALTGILWADDGQIVRQEVRKIYCDKGSGCSITVQEGA